MGFLCGGGEEGVLVGHKPENPHHPNDVEA